MKNLFRKIATLRTTIAFALGILLASRFSMPANILLGLVLLLVGCAILLNKYYRYSFESPFGWSITLLFIVLGSLFYSQYNKQPRFYSSGKFIATVLETSEEKPNSYKSLLQLDAVVRNDSVIPSTEKVLVYFEKTQVAKQLQPGNTILFEKAPEQIENNGNPFEFDYKAYLSRKKIYRRIYLAQTDWLQGENHQSSPKTIAEEYRNKLLAIYHRYDLGEQQTEILSALTLGYKRGLDPETKRIFSSAGAMHVLAVSGLHVGILFGVFTLLFGFIRKQKYGKLLFVMLGLLVLWSYAFITGLSPSVMRAATMFSLVCIATNINRRPNIYNTLSFSAFVLLILNPNNLFEVGFQLSYAAVFGIVFLQPKLSKLWPVKNKILKFFWTLLSVSIAAQIATFPITSFYFNQFPSYFWLSNLVVIPAVFILICSGILLLIFSTVPFISNFIALITQWILNSIYIFLANIEDLPFAVAEISLTKLQLLFLIFALLFSFSFAESGNIKRLKFTLLSLILLATSTLIINFRNLNSNELIVYNNSQNLTLHLIKGKTNYVISENEISDSDYILRQIETVRIKKKLNDVVFVCSNDTINSPNLFYKNHIANFEGKLIWFQSDKTKAPAFFQPDLIVTNQRFSNNSFNNQAPVVSCFNYRNSDFGNVYFLKKNGAFHQKWHSKYP